jgi:hypothetical protein
MLERRWFMKSLENPNLPNSGASADSGASTETNPKAKLAGIFSANLARPSQQI